MTHSDPGIFEAPISLRPHHLLCTQGYSGKGYSDAFVARMTAVTKRLREDPDIEVTITLSSDSICSACPSRLDGGRCEDDIKVLKYDKAVRELLDLKEGTYRYHDLIYRLDTLLSEGGTDEKLFSICGDCSWYPVSACRKNILTAAYCRNTGEQPSSR